MITTTRLGRQIFIRPLKPEDAGLFERFWNSLSDRSIYYRFSRCIKKLHPDLLIKLTQPDYDREVALTALDADEPEETMLAAAGLIWPPGSTEAEFSVVVGDPWQGQGIGAELLRRLILIARKRGVKSIWGLVLRENRGMIDLARKQGFSIVPHDGGSQLEIRLNLPGETP